MKALYINVVMLFICELFLPVSSSLGDRSVIYQRCLNNCVHENCTDASGVMFKRNAAKHQDFWCKVLRWTCREECYYQCMWYTVRSFERAGEGIPKFHGKWPFERFMGMQEPASAFASVLNFLANYYMFKKFRGEFPFSTALRMPIIIFYQAYAVVCMNAWVWSTIFHMRDSPFTEFMDYACALSMVMGLFVASIVRVCYKRIRVMTLVLAVPLFYFVAHVRYLYSGVINYDYNMKLNVFFVTVAAWFAPLVASYYTLGTERGDGSAGACVWACVAGAQVAAGRGRCAWRALAFVLLSGAALALELFDFPPRARAWDAHALWHLATAPLPLLFFRYVIDDLRYLQSKEQEKFAFKLT